MINKLSLAKDLLKLVFVKFQLKAINTREGGPSFSDLIQSVKNRKLIE